MFEKEAEETVDKSTWLFPQSKELAKDFWQKGAEFGYNKANEWHYVKDGDLPKEPKRYLCQIKYNVGGAITYECSDYDVEYNSWTDSYGDVIAWKEIVLPKESE